MNNLEKEIVANTVGLSSEEAIDINGGIVLTCAVLGAAGSVLGLCLAVSYYTGYYYESHK